MNIKTRLTTLVAALAVMSAATARAAITATFPSAVQIAPPASVIPGALQSNTTIYTFDEQQSVPVPATIPVDITAAGFYNTAASLTPGAIVTGTVVDVHLIHFDQLGPGQTTLDGTIQFDGDIIGVQILSATLDTADVLGTAGAYPTGDLLRGLELNGEFVSVLPGLRDIRVHLITSNVIDQVRVFTQPVDEPNEPKPFVWEFSLDIGSDKEMSDPQMDGDEGFDPGDVYFSSEGPVTPPIVPCGRDASIKDDAMLFPADPFPNPPDCFGMTAAPVGSMCPPADCFQQFFDLDAHDQIDVDLRQWIINDAPLPSPLPRDVLIPPGAAANCIFDLKFVMVSYDDDRAPNWSMGDVPVTAPSPMGVSSYGSTAARDEIVGLTLAPLGVGFSVVDIYPVASEGEVHPDLRPNPDMGDAEDDDVDSLDIVRNDNPNEPDGPVELCPFWTWSPDHEAVGPAGFDPGGIYLTVVFGGGAPVKIIDEAIHLGIPEDADIDAFEFVWLPDPDTGVVALALIFSVDDDDPFTGFADESGGMMPGMIYGSFMTGFSFPLLAAGDPALQDDIDAITNWCESLNPPAPPCLCPGDLNSDTFLNGLDIQPFLDCVLSGPAPAPGCDCADLNGDGLVEFLDVADFVALLIGGAVCP